MKKTASIVLTLLLCMVMTSCSKTAREEKRLLKGMMSENYETSAKALSEFITWMQTDKATMSHDFPLMREKLGMKIVNSPDSLVRCYSWVTGQFENNASYANIIQWMTEGHFVGYSGPIDHLLAGREANLKAQETLAHSIDTILEIRFGKQPVYLIAQSYTNRKGFRRAYVSASTIAALSLRLLPFFFDGTEIAGNNEFIDEANVPIGDLFKWDEKNRLFYAYQVDDSSRLIPGQYTIYKLGEKNFVKQ